MPGYLAFPAPTRSVHATCDKGARGMRHGSGRASSGLRRALVAAGLVVTALAAGASAAPSAPGRFPSPPAGAPSTIWAVGDGAAGTSAARGVASMVAAAHPAAFLYLGDVYEFGTAGEFAHNYDPVYGAMRSITLPTPGNHDWSNHAVGYDPYWSAVTGGRPPSYYAVSVGGWRLISLNSEEDHGPGSAQSLWLARQLRAPGTCRLAFWHRPRFSAGLHGDQPDIAPFWRALRGHAAMVLNGHDHDMQLMRPKAGITELVAGAGGRGHYPVDAADPRLAWSDDTSDGAVRITLEPGRARYAFVATGGRVLRSGSVGCTPPA
jgi:hypothetical protein